MAKAKSKGKPLDDAAMLREKALMRAISGNKRDGTQMPLQTREAPISNVDADKRTFDVTWTTGAKVRRYDWFRERFYWEELSTDPAAVRMQRLQSGRAPVLDVHSSWSLQDVLGVVTTAALRDGAGTATIKMSKRDDVAPILEDIRDGILGNVSVGYSIYRVEMLPPKAGDGDVWTYRVIDWEPCEVSLVPIGADAGAGREDEDARFNRCEFISPEADAAGSSESSMFNVSTLARAMGITIPDGADEAASRAAVLTSLKLKPEATDDEILAAAVRKPEATPPAAVPPADAAKREADAADAAFKRAAEVVSFCRKHKAGDDFEQKALTERWSLERCAVEILNQRAERGDTTGPSTVPANTAQKREGSWDHAVQARGGK